MFHQKNHKISCSNCGQFGHNYRQCLEPITSYGMIIFRINGPWNQAAALMESALNITGYEQVHPNIEYLLIQRRDSLGFVEIMRGKYKLQDVGYLKQQLAGTTARERERLLTEPFDELWVNLWGVPASDGGQNYRSEKEVSRMKLESLRKGYFEEGTSQFIQLEQLLRELPAAWPTPEWGFPKGRRDLRENEFKCAMREVMEETSLTERDLIPIRNMLPIQESFFGSNRVHYCHKYFMSYMPAIRPIQVDKHNEHMIREVGNIGWFKLDDALQMIRPDNIEKREILLKASSLLRNYCALCLSEPQVDG